MYNYIQIRVIYTVGEEENLFMKTKKNFQSDNFLRLQTSYEQRR